MKIILTVCSEKYLKRFLRMACISIAQGGRKFKAEPKNVAANIAANILNSTDEMAIAFMNSFQKEWPILADTGFTTALDMADTYGITIPYIRGILSSTGITKNDVIRRFVKRTSSDYLLYNLDQLVKAGELKSAIICEGSACGQESGYHHICMIDNENKKFNVTVCRNNNFNKYVWTSIYNSIGYKCTNYFCIKHNIWKQSFT